MAPTICLPELSMQKTSQSSYNSRCRKRTLNNGIIKEHQQQSLRVKRIYINNSENERLDSLSPPVSPVWGSTYPRNSFSVDKNCDRWRSILARRKGLLDIVARTMVLVRRNQMLQKRVNALRTETREFVRSVLSNPENKNNNKDKQEDNDRSECFDNTMEEVSSSCEILSSRPTPPPTPDSSIGYAVFENERECTSVNSSNFYSSSYSPVSITSFDSGTNSDYSSDDSDSTPPRMTQDPKVSSS